MESKSESTKSSNTYIGKGKVLLLNFYLNKEERKNKFTLEFKSRPVMTFKIQINDNLKDAIFGFTVRNISGS